MGIKGLDTFIKQNPKFIKPYKLHDTYVIIDGNNLMHRLYFNYEINIQCGGDYKKYADTIKRYFSAYAECNIKPIIVFDGGCDKSNQKLNTIIERWKARLKQAVDISKNGSSCKILPRLANQAFRATVSELNITFAQSDYEADDQISVLANFYKCPVVSADSDFYICDLNEGLILLDSINPMVTAEMNSNGDEYKFLNCEIYHIDRFIECFPGINKKLLPLFGVLLGNDFIKGHEFSSFYSNIKLPEYEGIKLEISNNRQQKMISVLSWLKHDTVNKAIEDILIHVNREEQVHVKLIIENAFKSFNLCHSNLTPVINKQDTKLLKNWLTTPCGKSLPNDVILKLREGKYPAFFIDIITHHQIFSQALIENFELPSTYSCSTFIRQIIYGILIRHDKCNNAKCLSPVCEFDRDKQNLRKFRIRPIFSLKSYGLLPKLNELSVLKKESSELILSEALGVNFNLFSCLPKEWHLFIASVVYWMRNCVVPNEFFYSLLLNLLYFSNIKCGYFMGEKCNETCRCSSVMCLLANITKFELQNASEKLDKYEQPPSFNLRNRLIITFVHSYNQLQTCVLYAMHLNQLLGDFLEKLKLSKCLGGTFLYNMSENISRERYPELYISELLGKETALLKLFNSLKDVIYQNL